MRKSLSHLSDRDLLQSFVSTLARDRGVTADLLAHIAEIDARKLYLPAGYPSMRLYCVEEFGMSEDAAQRLGRYTASEMVVAAQSNSLGGFGHRGSLLWTSRLVRR